MQPIIIMIQRFQPGRSSPAAPRKRPARPSGSPPFIPPRSRLWSI